MKNPKRLLVASTVLGMALFGIVPGGVVTAKADQTTDSQIEADVHKTLDNKRFQDVTISVHDGDVLLRGKVDVYADKEDADRRAHHVHHVKGVDNDIEVAGDGQATPASDVALRDKIAKGLAYDRVGYGTTAFNAISIGVKDGVVTLSGTVYGPTDKDSALSLVRNTRGVRDVIDNLEVAPVSPMDDGLRIQLARTIYGAPQLNKYALDPAKPIRITVVNGHVTLSGVVDNKMDKDVAGIKANSVPGVFSVANELQVAGPEPGK